MKRRRCGTDDRLRDHVVILGGEAEGRHGPLVRHLPLKVLLAPGQLARGEQALGDELEESGMLNDITESRVPNNVLNLAVGDIAFVLRTLDRDAHIVTNARVEILAINQQTVRVRVLSTGKEASIPKINFSFKLGRSSLQVVRVQFPLELAYAMTFNKGVHAQILPSGAFLDPAID